MNFVENDVTSLHTGGWPLRVICKPPRCASEVAGGIARKIEVIWPAVQRAVLVHITVACVLPGAVAAERTDSIVPCIKCDCRGALCSLCNAAAVVTEHKPILGSSSTICRRYHKCRGNVAVRGPCAETNRT